MTLPATRPPQAAMPATPPPKRANVGNGAAPRAAAPAVIGSRKSEAFRAPRIMLVAVEGFGKTSCGAFAPDPIILMSREETGYETLLAANLVPDVPAAKIESWGELLATLDTLIDEGGRGAKTLVLDAVGGFERMCHEHTCAKHFDNDWGEKGFLSYHKGYDMAVNEWTELLAKLDKFQELGVTVLLLAHSKVKTVKNPLGADYDAFTPDLHDKTLAPTKRWADSILFGNFVTVVLEDAKKKGKKIGVGGSERVIHTQHCDAWDAKNRYAMPERLEIPGGRQDAIFSIIWNSMSGASPIVPQFGALENAE